MKVLAIINSIAFVGSMESVDINKPVCMTGARMVLGYGQNRYSWGELAVRGPADDTIIGDPIPSIAGTCEVYAVLSDIVFEKFNDHKGYVKRRLDEYPDFIKNDL